MLQVILQMEKGNLMLTKEARFAIPMIVGFIWSNAKETLLILKKNHDDHFVIVKHHGNHLC